MQEGATPTRIEPAPLVDGFRDLRPGRRAAASARQRPIDPPRRWRNGRAAMPGSSPSLRSPAPCRRSGSWAMPMAGPPRRPTLSWRRRPPSEGAGARAAREARGAKLADADAGGRRRVESAAAMRVIARPKLASSGTAMAAASGRESSASVVRVRGRPASIVRSAGAATTNSRRKSAWAAPGQAAGAAGSGGMSDRAVRRGAKAGAAVPPHRLLAIRAALLRAEARDLARPFPRVVRR